MQTIFEYPSEFEAAEVERKFHERKKLIQTLSKAIIIMLFAGVVSIVVALATTGLVSKLCFVSFVIILLTVFATRKLLSNTTSEFVFVSAYEDRMELIKYDNDLQGRTEALIYYADIVKSKIKKNTITVVIYETNRSFVVRYDSEGHTVENTNIFNFSVAASTDLKDFFLNTAPSLIN